MVHHCERHPPRQLGELKLTITLVCSEFMQDGEDELNIIVAEMLWREAVQR